MSTHASKPDSENARIPTSHVLLEAPRVKGFSHWMDTQLLRLEDQFASFVTGGSQRVSRRRYRQN